MVDPYDLIVVGAGSGGIGAALAGARLGLSVLLVEKADRIGGNAVRGGVSCWEPGVGGTGIPFDIYRRLRRIPGAIGIYSLGRHRMWWDPTREAKPFPGGEQVIDPQRRYYDTLQRHGTQGLKEDAERCRVLWHGVVFEPDIYCRAVEEMLDETGGCTVLKNTTFAEVRYQNGQISSMSLDNGQEITADVYVDSTADALLCLACDCQVMTGQEGRDAFGERNAPEVANDRINGVTLVYRVTPADRPRAESLPQDVPINCWWSSAFPSASVAHYPNGDLNVNMLPSMEGAEFLALGYPKAHAQCRRRVLAHWHYLQATYPEFQSYRLHWIAPALGVRESCRMVGEYVLTEHDLLAGIGRQSHPDIICLADHAMDTHGGSTGRSGCRELQEPYGVPFRCLIPKGFRNLLIACRSASFSSIAASSCRLSRTMIQLGQAAGTAAWVAQDHGVDVCEAPADALRASLRRQHVQLEWPIPSELAVYLESETI